MKLTGNKIKNTYGGLLNIGATGMTGSGVYQVTDGFGTPIPMLVGTQEVDFIGTLSVNGIIVDPQSGFYGVFWSNQTQTNAGATAANVMTFNNADGHNRIHMANNSRLTFEVGGVYNIQFSAQFDKTDSGNDDVEVWFSKNGSNIPESSSIVTLVGNNGKLIASWNFMLSVNANDYIELYWHSNDTDMRILAQAGGTNPTRPSIPSIILTAQQVANLLLGATGATGSPGATGAAGISGTSGTSGISGTSGTSGVSGTSGTSGVSGTSGTSGVSGTSGTSGVSGTSGTSGVTGAQGPAGANGTSGTSGVNGTSGTSGTSGVTGAQGPAGANGTSGTSGVNGTSGTSGVTGPQGLQGPQGATGATGIKGVTGATGATGQDGADSGLSVRLKYNGVASSVTQDPTSGKFLINPSPDWGTVDPLYINVSDFDTYGINIYDYWNQLAAWLSIGTNSAQLVIAEVGSPSVKAIVPVTNISYTGSTHWTIYLNPSLYASGILTVGTHYSMSWIGQASGQEGPRGVDAPIASEWRFNDDSAWSTPPTSFFNSDDFDFALTTKFSISNIDYFVNDQSLSLSYLAFMLSSGNSVIISFRDILDLNNVFATYSVNTITSASGYYNLGVSYINSGSGTWNGGSRYVISFTIGGKNGTPGVTGAAGVTGATGPQGAAGVTGATGPQGPIGNTGSVQITNAGANKVLTSSSGGTSAIAQNNLTFDGSELKVTGQGVSNIFSNGATFGASATINWDNGNVQNLTLNATISNLFYTNIVPGGVYTLILTIGASGAGITNWPTGTKWPSSITPTLSSGVGQIDIVSVIAGGTASNLYSVINQKF